MTYSSSKLFRDLLNQIKKSHPTVLDKARQNKFTFLIIGRTGVGKSSTINALMGQDVAAVGKFRLITDNVNQYESQVFGVNFNLIDTPGFADSNNNKDKEYINTIKSTITDWDCMWFITRLDDNRVRTDEIETIKYISSAFGEKGWKKAIIVFTHADKVEEDEYQEYLTERTRLIRETIARDIDHKIAREIPSIAVANKYTKEGKLLPTPDGNLWLGNLYAAIIKRISDRGLLPMFISTAERVISQEAAKQVTSLDAQQELIVLNDSQIQEIKARVNNQLRPPAPLKIKILVVILVLVIFTAWISRKVLEIKRQKLPKCVPYSEIHFVICKLLQEN